MKKLDLNRWNSRETLQTSTDQRAQFAAQFLPSGSAVLDIGCGKMPLEKHLEKQTTYLPCDTSAKDARTIICDLLQGKMPPADSIVRADYVTILGVAEYVEDLPGFMKSLRSMNKPVIMTYHPGDISDRTANYRESMGWVNDLTTSQLANLFVTAEFTVENIEKVNDEELLFKISPNHRPIVKQKKVAVISNFNSGNFGDRLGYQLLNSVMPANAEVRHHAFTPWSLTDMRDVDLVILGLGNSLRDQDITGHLQTVIENAPASIGIFGTEYRDQIDPSKMSKLIDGLDVWFARTKEDQLRFGKGKENALHFGDWRIDAFPMAKATSDEILAIAKDVLNEAPLDRAIQKIQQHKLVVSTHLSSLLCALTSAEVVQYSEEMNGGEKSGKFRSALIDIFGRTYPEGIAWNVDRNKVMQYKQTMSENVHLLRQHLAALLM